MVLAGRYGINPKTVAKWRKRTHVTDARMGPKGDSFDGFDAGRRSGYCGVPAAYTVVA